MQLIHHLWHHGHSFPVLFVFDWSYIVVIELSYYSYSWLWQSVQKYFPMGWFVKLIIIKIPNLPTVEIDKQYLIPVHAIFYSSWLRPNPEVATLREHGIQPSWRQHTWKTALSWHFKQLTLLTLQTIDTVFIGPRYTWGPIYGSECLKLTKRGFADFASYASNMQVMQVVQVICKLCKLCK